MLQLEDIEQLSRFISGDLPPADTKILAERIQQRPELAEALARLRRLDEVCLEASKELSTPAPDPAIERALAPRARRSFALRGALAAGVAALIGGALLLSFRKPDSEHSADHLAQVSTGGGPDSAKQTLMKVKGGDVTLIGEEARASEQGDQLALAAGTALARGEGVAMRHGDVQVVVHGVAVFSSEPPSAPARVMEMLPNHGDDMREKIERWKRTNLPALAGTALALFVIDGHAQVVAGGESTAVRAGETWTRPNVQKPPLLVAQNEKRQVQPSSQTEKPRGDSAWLEAKNLDAAQLGSALDKASDELSKCLKTCKDERCAGQFRTKVTIKARGGKGKLEEATIDEDYSIQNPFIASCVISALTAVDFPAPTGDGVATLNLPFVVNRRPLVEGGGLQLVLPRISTTLYEDDGKSKRPFSVGDAPSKGPVDAPVTIVVFADFECPYCSRALGTLQRIETKYSGKVRIAFRHRPMDFHPHAQLAAVASMAAHEQGKFWEYHDVLFANTNALDRASLERYARELGLDMSRFVAAVDSGRLESVVAADVAEAQRVGARGTPAFLINGRLVVGARPFDHFAAVIDEELGSVGRRPK